MNRSVHRVLIVGGGFSGMAAAIECAKRGLEVDLVEIDAGWRSYGAGISIGGPTLRALRTIGVLDAFLAHGHAGDGVNLFTPNGAPLGSIPTPRVAGDDVPGGGAIMRPTARRHATISSSVQMASTRKCAKPFSLMRLRRATQARVYGARCCRARLTSTARRCGSATRSRRG
jgi:2-polyprenyl-6-methoxyphenol hydroxylase-like FAD-dependent oxidoreductase